MASGNNRFSSLMEESAFTRTTPKPVVSSPWQNTAPSQAPSVWQQNAAPSSVWQQNAAPSSVPPLAKQPEVFSGDHFYKNAVTQEQPQTTTELKQDEFFTGTHTVHIEPGWTFLFSRRDSADRLSMRQTLSIHNRRVTRVRSTHSLLSSLFHKPMHAGFAEEGAFEEEPLVE